MYIFAFVQKVYVKDFVGGNMHKRKEETKKWWNDFLTTIITVWKLFLPEPVPPAEPAAGAAGQVGHALLKLPALRR